ncbi:hypothetical protein [Streptomyces sp. DSM 40907]|uniref:hypothetical protein n=1 Tax=Streptomyces kutzneri TaxID=3051179 RepID=UPI0028D3B16A|nr:hypothetical protein [Streptomyces sp. DSM 40907]
MLGDSSRISTGLNALWRSWQYSAERGWEGPESRSVSRYDLVHGIRPDKNGHAEALEGAARLIQSWEDEARAGAAATDSTPTVWVTARLPEATEEPSRGGAPGVPEGLDRWTLGVVVTWTVTADWGRRTLTLRVPALVADRLLDPSGSLACEPGGSEAVATEAGQGQPDSVRPGVLDDTAVFDRQPVTPAHLRALRNFSYAAGQLYIVFSTSGGAEVLPLDAIEKRVAQGWLGVIVAGASDLPESVISPWIKEVGLTPEVRFRSGIADADTGGARFRARHPRRPYDLRHAGISFWLHSGVDPAECARRAGQSIQVLFQYYAKFLDGLQEHSNRLIEESMQEWSRRSADAGTAD